MVPKPWNRAIDWALEWDILVFRIEQLCGEASVVDNIEFSVQ